MREPILSLRGVRREFQAGDETVVALRDVDIKIAAGEMVAIIGASGSGKSTLMAILGCLDRPTAGIYRIAGRETRALGPDALAQLRREHFGFIFQRYHLLGDISAQANVEIPAVYAGIPAARREGRAKDLLDRLGMGERRAHRPSQLSGGQQQRVSIARALMNDAQVILADEPTGALDSRSGEEVLRILEDLNREGRTVVIVTHDPAVAARAGRIIEMRDGAVISDRGTPRTLALPRIAARPPGRGGLGVNRLREAAIMALQAMNANRLRMVLTMLGIIIGIASVVNVVALGSGAQREVLANIAGLGTNTLEIMPGRDMGDVRSGRIRTLVAADAVALGEQPYVEAITPTVQTSKTVRVGPVAATTRVNGVGAGYFEAKALTLIEGRLFGPEEVAKVAQEVVIDVNLRDAISPEGSALGKVLLIGRMPARVIGIVKTEQGPMGGGGALSAYLPYTSVQARLTGGATLRSIILRVRDGFDMRQAEEDVTHLLADRHDARDFFIINTDDIRNTITSTTRTLTLLIAAIAGISLVVGGIGVMNIMLVSVSERVGEIGVRMAVGARRGDILRQFLVEAVLVCMVGGVLGVAGALALGAGFYALGTGFALIYSPTSILIALVSSSLIGIVFGYLPARRAARLDPVLALAKD